MTTGTTRADRYRAGLCIDCGLRRYSAGLPRCGSCHETRIEAAQRHAHQLENPR